MDESERQLHFFALLARVQVMESTISALIQSHPDVDDLKECLESNYSMLLSSLSTQLVGKGKSLDIANQMKQHMDDNLALLQED